MFLIIVLYSWGSLLCGSHSSPFRMFFCPTVPRDAAFTRRTFNGEGRYFVSTPRISLKGLMETIYKLGLEGRYLEAHGT